MTKCICEKKEQPIIYKSEVINHEIKRPRLYPVLKVTKKETKNENR